MAGEAVFASGMDGQVRLEVEGHHIICSLLELSVETVRHNTNTSDKNCTVDEASRTDTSLTSI